jgi:hypothetical protein
MLANMLRLGSTVTHFREKNITSELSMAALKHVRLILSNIIRTIINSIVCIQVNKPPPTQLLPSVRLEMNFKFPFPNNVCPDVHLI